MYRLPTGFLAHLRILAAFGYSTIIPRNLAILRKIAVNLISRSRTTRISMRARGDA
jgi:hypothetical protein